LRLSVGPDQIDPLYRRMLLAAEERSAAKVAFWRPLPEERPQVAQKSISRIPEG
jgi:hypothetical protein